MSRAPANVQTDLRVADASPAARALTPRRRGDRLTDFLVRRFSAICDLDDEDARLVREASARATALERGQTWPHSDGEASFLVSGWASLETHLTDGRRQIIGLLTPGDEIGFARRFLPPTLDVVALTRATTVDAGSLLDAARSRPAADEGLGCARARLSEYNEIFLLNQILRLGRMTAFERVAHLFAELHWRLAQVGLADGKEVVLPLSQEIIAHTLGLSAIHVNRTLRQLKDNGLIEIRGGKASLPNAKGVSKASGFVPPLIGVPASGRHL